MSTRNHECEKTEVEDGIVWLVTYNQFGEEVAREFYCKEEDYEEEIDGYGKTVLPWSQRH